MLRACALLACLGVAARASAQPANQQQQCMSLFSGPIGVAFPKVPGTRTDYQSVANTRANTAFGRAECECATTDGAMQIQATTPIPSAMQVGNIEYWVGAGCDNYTTRTNSTTIACEKYSQTFMGLSLPAYNCFTSLTTGCASGVYQFANIPAQALFSPIKHDCTAVSNPTNDVYMILYPQGQDVMSAPICALNMTESMQGPPPVGSISAAAGDSAVTLNWTQAVAGTAGNATQSFQVLCADKDGNPIPGKLSSQQAYSVCLSPPGPGGTDGTISRRNTIYFGGSGGGTDDGGVFTDFDLSGTTGFSEPLLDTQAVGDDGGTDAGATVLMLNKQVLNNNDSDPTGIDPRYICSDELQIGGLSYQKRIDGLNNNEPYQFMVLTIDAYGNVGRSPVLVAMPTPTEDLWRRWYHDTGYSPGFCSVSDTVLIAGDVLLVLLAIAWLAWPRRRRA